MRSFSKRSLGLLPTVLLVIGSLHSLAQSGPLGAASDFNAFVEGDFISANSEVLGPLAAGAYVQLNNYGINMDQIGNTGLVVGGFLAYNHGEIWGDAVTGGGAYMSSVGIHNGNLYTHSPLIDFAGEFQYLRDLSAYWASLNDPSTQMNLSSWGGLTLEGTNAVNVFNISEDVWRHTGQVDLYVPNGATVIINVAGAYDNIPHAALGWFGALFMHNGDNWQNVIWNFYEATQMSMQAVGWKGSILAPYAHFQGTNGNIKGHLIVKKFSMKYNYGIELHFEPFTGNAPLLP